MEPIHYGQPPMDETYPVIGKGSPLIRPPVSKGTGHLFSQGLLAELVFSAP